MFFKSILNKIAKASLIESPAVPPDNFEPLIRAINRCGDVTPGYAPTIFLPEGPNLTSGPLPELPACPDIQYEQYEQYRLAYNAKNRCPKVSQLPLVLELNGINPQSLINPPYSNARGFCLNYEITAFPKYVQEGFNPCPLNTVPACRCCCYTRSGSILRASPNNPTNYEGLCGHVPYLPGPILGD